MLVCHSAAVSPLPWTNTTGGSVPWPRAGAAASASSSQTASSRLSRGRSGMRVDEDLGVALGRAERLEGVGHAVETDATGDQRDGGDLALGDVAQRGGELLRRVAQHELEVQLLHD